MTVPFGRGAAATEGERTYDRALLERLLRSWTIEDMTFVERQGENVWWRLGDGAGPISSRRLRRAGDRARRPAAGRRGAGRRRAGRGAGEEAAARRSAQA